MNIRWKILSALVLSLGLSACIDPVVGRWEGKEDRAVDLEIEAAKGGYEGEGHIYLCGSKCILCPFDFEARKRGDDELKVEGRFTGVCSELGSFDGVECEVDGDEMECQVPGGLLVEYEKVD